ncbi:MAG: response regulator [Oscillochloris sp.]|nr:response regulator [Oscillochloris sp.]
MKTILLVDDDIFIVRALQAVLARAGYDVHIARNGMQALAVLDTTAIQLVITDLRMPDLGGPEIIEVLRSHSQQPPIIVISGDVRARSMTESLLKVDVVLSKPVNTHELLAHVSRLFPRAFNSDPARNLN